MVVAGRIEGCRASWRITSNSLAVISRLQHKNKASANSVFCVGILGRLCWMIVLHFGFYMTPAKRSAQAQKCFQVTISIRMHRTLIVRGYN